MLDTYLLTEFCKWHASVQPESLLTHKCWGSSVLEDPTYTSVPAYRGHWCDTGSPDSGPVSKHGHFWVLCGSMWPWWSTWFQYTWWTIYIAWFLHWEWKVRLRTKINQNLLTEWRRKKISNNTEYSFIKIRHLSLLKNSAPRRKVTSSIWWATCKNQNKATANTCKVTTASSLVFPLPAPTGREQKTLDLMRNKWLLFIAAWLRMCQIFQNHQSNY